MKKLQILAAILAIGTMCITGCNMGGTATSDKAQTQTRNIVAQEDSVEETPTPTPDDNCGKDGNCNHDKMPHAKPNFKFKAPHGKHHGSGRDKFRRPHKRPAPKPEEPEVPAEEENTNN
ncbi:MAG: hypothetical protein J1G05_00920 [Clostridiales bacterium]|nr:hypothetical protein [Clostridiales bacterium]